MNICKQKGFSLLEMLLVLAIVSSLLILAVNFGTQKTDELRRDKAVLQMQQILNAGMSYYINKSAWPITCDGSYTSVLATSLGPYLPGLALNPYGNIYGISCDATTRTFSVQTAISSGASSSANAQIIAGRLPLASSSGTTVTASVNIPGQNLNNARAVNFGSIYYSGSCVPAPNCPPGMKPAIFVVPASVVGVNSVSSCPTTSDPRSCSGVSLYPVMSFTAYARGSGGTSNPGPPSGPSAPYDCQVSSPPSANVCLVNDLSGAALPTDGTLYWRACLSVTTQKGEVFPNPGLQAEGKMKGSVLAITRCVPNNGTESPSGSVNVFAK